MESSRFERTVRTESSEIFAIYGSGRRVGRIDLHYGRFEVRGTFLLEVDLTDDELQQVIDQINEELVQTHDPEREDLLVTVFKWRSLGSIRMSSKRTTPVTTTKRKSASGPRATRPRMPKGYGVPKTQRGMLPWAATRKMLEGAKSYWLVTIDPDGKPHLVGQWGAWIDDARISRAARTRSARNVAHEPRIAMGAESGTSAVMVEGHASRVPSVERPTSERITKQYGAKYGRLYKYRPKPDQWDKGGYVASGHAKAEGAIPSGDPSVR